ncbi:hypothetical protein BGZ49_009701 [Haplosporangium sp. Z 27]|nr:hypothetical protein BGZ49_009701 [Haplosporangium sp. Z 27]
MTRLNQKDNDVLRNQEWGLLFKTGRNNTSTNAASNSSNSTEIPLPLPKKFAQDTFLVKSFFSESNEKYYLILVTNLKQYWYEKLRIEDIRERSKRIKSFAYEEDSQIEALLLSLASIFTNENESASTPAPPAQRWIKKRHDKLSLLVDFKFGLSNVQWEFKLSPLLEVAGINNPNHPSNSLLSEPSPPKEMLSMYGSVSEGKQPSGKRTRVFLEDSEDEDIEDADQDDIEYDEEDSSSDNDGDDVDYGESSGNRKKPRRKKVDGMSVMFDHLVLPLIALTSAYHNQIRILESVVKSKENEVVEALEMLEQGGVGYHNRRKATERYDKTQAAAKLQKDIEQRTRPHLSGVKELLSDKTVPTLLSIVSKNAANRDSPLSTFDGSTMSSQGMSSLNHNARGTYSSQAARRSGDIGTSSQPIPNIPAGGVSGDSDTGNEGTSAKATKEAEELERRRILQEQLDKEKAEKERARKKKKLF